MSGAPISFQAESIVTMNGFTVNADYITVRNLEISDTKNDGSSGWGTYVQSSNCLIENKYVHNVTCGEILINAVTGSEGSAANCIILNNCLLMTDTNFGRLTDPLLSIQVLGISIYKQNRKPLTPRHNINECHSGYGQSTSTSSSGFDIGPYEYFP